MVNAIAIQGYGTRYIVCTSVKIRLEIWTLVMAFIPFLNTVQAVFDPLVIYSEVRQSSIYSHGTVKSLIS